MLQPRRRFTLILASAVIAAAASVTMYVIRPPEEFYFVQSTARTAAGGCALFLFMYCFVPLGAYRRSLRLKRGEGVIARWTVPTVEWRQFVQWEEEQQKSKRGLPNAVDYKRLNGDGDVEIIVARYGVLVGDDVHALQGRDENVSPPQLTKTDPVLVEMRIKGDHRVQDVVIDCVVRFPTSRAEMFKAQQLVAEF